jgi:hypothetical protein
MTKHRYGDLDKLVEQNTLKQVVSDALLQLKSSKAPELSAAGYRCSSAMNPMNIDDPSRLPTVMLQPNPPRHWIMLYRITKVSKELVLAWWEYKRGSLPALDVVVRASVLLWMLDNVNKLYDLKQEMPCELPRF